MVSKLTYVEPHESILELDTKNQKSREKALNTLDKFTKVARPQPKSLQDQFKQLEEKERAQEMERMQIRRWNEGDVYAPHDLSPAELKKWRHKSRPDRDVFDILAINPINHYMVSATHAQRECDTD